MEVNRNPKPFIGGKKMKKVLVTVFSMLAVILVASLAVPTVQAQDVPKPMSFMLGAGVSLPMGDFGDGFKMGFHGTGRVDINLAAKLDLLLGADYHVFSIDDQGASNVDGGSASILNLAGDLKFNLGSPAMSSNPYLMGGTGLAIENRSDLTIGATTFTFDSETDVFIEVGGGVEFNKFFIQAKFVDIFTEGSSTTYVPLTVGLKF